MSTLVAYMWWCGDDECDCTQPVIERYTERGRFFNIERLWEGSFHSQRDPDERAQQEAEMMEAAARFGIELSREDEYSDLYGRKEEAP